MLQLWFKRHFRVLFVRGSTTRRQSATTLTECLERHEPPRNSRKPLKIAFIFCIIFTIMYICYYQEVLVKSTFSDMGPHFDSMIEDIVINETTSRTKTIDVNDFIQKGLYVTMQQVPEDIEPELIIKQNQGNLPKCVEIFVGNVSIKRAVRYNEDFETMYPELRMGGHYIPLDCKARHKVAILVPIRNREANLRTFLYNIHPFLMRQKIEYRIFVVEQSGDSTFNKGRLFNAGFLEIQKTGDWECVVFHDVDLLPTNDRIRYSCPILPRHMCASVVEEEKHANYKTVFGGVTAMTMWQYKAVNGYSNLYWGWGGEDNDMLKRLQATGTGVTRYKKQIARYVSLPHAPSPVNKLRYTLLQKAMKRYKTDGLTNIKYHVVSYAPYHLYTRLLIDINPKALQDYITEPDLFKGSP